MTAALAKATDDALIERVIIQGDLSKLSPGERVHYYARVCESVGLNPLTKPFEYLRINGREVLYATRTCTDQLRQLHGVSIQITSREKIGDVYVVTAKAIDGSGRSDESTGAVTLGHLSGEDLANALMKAETKAKRRVTLSICGLGMLDESEVETIPGSTSVAAAVQGDEPQSQYPERVQAMIDQAEHCTSEDDIRTFSLDNGKEMSRMDAAHSVAIFRAIKHGKPTYLTVAQIKEWLRQVAFGGELRLAELDNIDSDVGLSAWLGRNLAGLDALSGEERDLAMQAVYDTAERLEIADERVDAWLEKLRGAE